MITADQIMTANKSSAEVLFGLTTKAFEGIEKLVELNLQVARSAIADTAANTKTALAVKDPQELLSLQAGLLQPAGEKAATYGRLLCEIASAASADFTKASDAMAAAAQSKFLAVVDTAVKNAPAGTENAAALVKSTVAAANNAYESMQKAAKKANAAAEASFQSLSASLSKATKVKKTG